MRRYVLPLAVAGAVVAAAVRPGLPAREPPSPAAADSTAAAEREDQFRKTRLLGGDRWRRVAFEFDAWLREQPVYTPAEAAGIRADLDRSRPSSASSTAPPPATPASGSAGTSR
jgi:hypothetical protein